MKTIEVIYENGVFKPLSPVNLPEGTRGRIEIDSRTEVINKVFGIFKGKDTLKLLEELRHEGNIR